MPCVWLAYVTKHLNLVVSPIKIYFEDKKYSKKAKKVEKNLVY